MGQPQDWTLLNIRDIDTDAQSYDARPGKSVLMNAEDQKRQKYSITACEESHLRPWMVLLDKRRMLLCGVSNLSMKGGTTAK